MFSKKISTSHFLLQHHVTAGIFSDFWTFLPDNKQALPWANCPPNKCCKKQHWMYMKQFLFIDITHVFFYTFITLQKACPFTLIFMLHMFLKTSLCLEIIFNFLPQQVVSPKMRHSTKYIYNVSVDLEKKWSTN